MSHENERSPQTSAPSAAVAEGGRSPTGAAAADGAGAPPVVRWHAKRKAEVVLRLLRGEPLDALSRELGAPIARLEQWRDEGLAGLQAALQARASDDPLRLKLDEANRRVGELSMEVELLRARCEKNGPFVGRRSKR